MGRTVFNLRRWEGPIEYALALFLFAKRKLKFRGPTLGYIADTGQSFGGGLHRWKQDGLTEVVSVAILGPQGIGKTFLAQKLILANCYTDTGRNEIVNRKGRRVRRRRRATVQIQSFKHNKGVPETKPLVKGWLRSKVIPLELVCLNFLSRAFGLTFDETFSLMMRIFKEANDHIALTPNMESILKDCVRALWDEESRGFEELVSYVTSYFSLVLAHLLAHQSQVAGLSHRQVEMLREMYPDEPGLMHQQGEDGAWVLNWERFDQLLDAAPFLGDSPVRYAERKLNDLLDASWDLLTLLKKFNGGTYHNLFSGTGEVFAKLLEQRAVSIDLKDVSNDVRTMVEMVLAAIDRSSSHPRNKKNEKCQRRRRDIILYDEIYGSLENEEFSNETYKGRKTQRAEGKIIILNIHRLSDFEAVGAEGSSQARKAANSLADIGVIFLGRMPTSEHDKVREYFNPPEHVMESLATLSKGTFWLKTATVEWVLVVIVGTPDELASFNTEAAHDERMSGYMHGKKLNLDDYRKILKETSPPPEEESSDQGVTADETLVPV